MSKTKSISLTFMVNLSILAKPAGDDMFKTLIEDLLADEGGAKISNRAMDKGGLTKWGISKRAHPDVDVVNLTREAATEIYFLEYWKKARVGDLPLGLAKLVFDGAVNHGVPSSIFMLQSAFNAMQPKDALKLDGVIGDKTLAAIAALAPDQVLDLLCKYAAERMKRYGSDATWSANGNGWSNRLLDNVREALELAITTTEAEEAA